MAHVVVTGISA